MIIPEEILAQIREIKDIFKNLNQSLLLDTFIYDENEYNIVKKNKFDFTKLENIDFERLIMNIIQNKINPAILNSLIKTLEEYNINYKSNYNKIKNFDREMLFIKFLEYRYLNKISILENDIREIRDEKNKMPDWLKDKECDYFKTEIVKINSEFKIGKEVFLWIKEDYYTLAYHASSEILKEIRNSFPNEEVLEMDEDIFKFDYTYELWKILAENKIINIEILTIENFHLIINNRNPKTDCKKSVTNRTLINFPLNELSKKVKGLKLNKEKWVSHVCRLLDLNNDSVTKHGYKKDENKIFYDFFGVK